MCAGRKRQLLNHEVGVENRTAVLFKIPLLAFQVNTAGWKVYNYFYLIYYYYIFTPAELHRS